MRNDSPGNTLLRKAISSMDRQSARDIETNYSSAATPLCDLGTLLSALGDSSLFSAGVL
jgi:hypothetical protein